MRKRVAGDGGRLDERAEPPGGARVWLGVYLRGVAMGAADAIPGVSGGTIALITGIYERLIDAIAGVTEHGPGLVAALLGREPPGGGSAPPERGEPRRARLRRALGTLRAMDVPFLVVLGLGVLTGVVTLANLVDLALVTYRAATFAFFFGVILASPVVLRNEVVLRAPRPLAAGVAGAALAYAIGGLPARQADYALPVLFLVGAVAICAMVLPGISGSLVLLIIGAYDTMTGAVSELTRGVGAVAGGGSADLLAPLTTLAVFALGALAGVLSFARLVAWAIETHRVPTMTFLVGVMVGALRTPARAIAASVGEYTPAVVAGLLLAGVVGVIVVLALEFATGGLE